jgi:hypothetical protein
MRVTVAPASPRRGHAPLGDEKPLVTEGGLVPRGNPDRLEWVRATRWLAYSLAGVDDLAGIEHAVGGLLEAYYVTCGNRGILTQMAMPGVMLDLVNLVKMVTRWPH